MSDSQAILTMVGSADGQEGINAFLAKRSPRFNGM
jgi:enoyl-CoA hydratase/carnithine racemase